MEFYTTKNGLKMLKCSPLNWNTADAAFAAADAKLDNQKLTTNICRKYLPIELWNI